MRAIVIASVPLSDWPELHGRHAACLLPLGDRPFLQHVVERLADAGIREIDTVQFEHPAAIERLLGDGTRWGIEIRHHLAREGQGVLERCQLIASRMEPGPVLLVHGDRLVLDELLPDGPIPPEDPLVFRYLTELSAGKSKITWSGWAWLPASLLSELPVGLDRASAEDWLVSRALATGRSQAIERPLAANPLADLLTSQHQLLKGEAPGLLVDGRDDGAGIRLSRAASVSDGAVLEPPVLVGERARIGRGARVGPNVALGDGSVVGAGARLRDALVLPDSYVGEAIDLSNAVVDRGLIAHVAVGAELLVTEEAIAAGLSSRDPLQPARLGSRLAALIGLTLGSPLLLLTALWVALRRRGPLLGQRHLVQLPASRDPAGWKRFRLSTFSAGPPLGAEGLRGLSDVTHRLLPGLFSVLRGDLSLVGIRPRTEEELQHMPEHWRSLCLSARAGLISEALVQHGPRPNEEEAFAAECLQAASTGLAHRSFLTLRYLGHVLRNRRGSSPTTDGETAATGL